MRVLLIWWKPTMRMETALHPISESLIRNTRSRSTELRKADHTLHIVKFGMVAQSLILILNGVGVGREDHTIKFGVHHQILILLVNGVGLRKESHIQGIEQAGAELLMLIRPVTAKRRREDVRRKGVTGSSHLTLILVIMSTRENTHLVVEDHLIRIEVGSVLGTTGIEEMTLHNVHEYDYSNIWLERMENSQ